MLLKHTFKILFIPMALGLVSCAESPLFSDPVNEGDSFYTEQMLPEKNDNSNIQTSPNQFFSVKQENLVEATVINIDYVTRVITLTVNELSIQLRVTKDARNFNEIVIGDTVMIEQRVNLAIEVLAESNLDNANREFAGTSISEKTEQEAWIKKSIIATVVSVNYEAKRFELEGPGGVVIEYTADETDNLNMIEAYNLVAISQTQIMAIYLDIPILDNK
jgi:hypothetical protein